MGRPVGGRRSGAEPPDRRSAPTDLAPTHPGRACDCRVAHAWAAGRHRPLPVAVCLGQCRQPPAARANDPQGQSAGRPDGPLTAAQHQHGGRQADQVHRGHQPTGDGVCRLGGARRLQHVVGDDLISPSQQTMTAPDTSRPVRASEHNDPPSSSTTSGPAVRQPPPAACAAVARPTPTLAPVNARQTRGQPPTGAITGVTGQVQHTNSCVADRRGQRRVGPARPDRCALRRRSWTRPSAACDDAGCWSARCSDQCGRWHCPRGSPRRSSCG